MAIFDASSFESATWWYIFSGRGLLLAGSITALGAIFTVAFLSIHLWSSNAREAFADKEKSELEAVAEIAQERAAALERETAALRTESNRGTPKGAARVLTAEQKSILVSELHGKIPEMNVVVQQDDEAKSFAAQLETAFSAAGVIMHSHELPAGEGAPAGAGVMMYRPGGDEDQAALEKDPLYIALKKSGLLGGTVPRPSATLELLSHGPELPLDLHTVYITRNSP